MHPVKSRKAIERSYFDNGVRIFALDCEAELEKIVAATGGAKDLTLVVRLAVSNADAGYALTGKFGIEENVAPALLSKARRFADELGVSFHVGSQCMSPSAYRDAMELASRVIKQAGVTVDVVDVGGGFPSAYPGMTPPDLTLYMNVIREAFEDMPILRARRKSRHRGFHRSTTYSAACWSSRFADIGLRGLVPQCLRCVTGQCARVPTQVRGRS